MNGNDTIDDVETKVITIPTDYPVETDGTLEWKSTTMVLAIVRVKDIEGIGYSYTSAGARLVIEKLLKPRIIGKNAFDINSCWIDMCRAIRNDGDSGLAMMAVAAADIALWDLKAKLLGKSVAALLGPSRKKIPVYGSGGFTSYTPDQLTQQLGGWARSGITRVKMKIGGNEKTEKNRAKIARDAIGPDCRLFVDANGAYDKKQALAIAQALMPFHITWFEEPVYHRDFAGTRYVREHCPPGLEIAAGEYGFEKNYFVRLLEGRVVDVLQADATRCGITGFMLASDLADAYSIPLSSHCAPSIHLHTCCAARPARHLEYFHDHVRIEPMIFDGVRNVSDGMMEPDWDRPGLGITLKRSDTKQFEE